MFLDFVAKELEKTLYKRAIEYANVMDYNELSKGKTNYPTIKKVILKGRKFNAN